MFERQRQWQRGRKTLTWAEKVHIAESIRETAQILRAGAKRPSGDADSLSLKP
jgi:hypothetical protein